MYETHDDIDQESYSCEDFPPIPTAYPVGLQREKTLENVTKPHGLTEAIQCSGRSFNFTRKCIRFARLLCYHYFFRSVMIVTPVSTHRDQVCLVKGMLNGSVSRCGLIISFSRHEVYLYCTALSILKFCNGTCIMHRLITSSAKALWTITFR